MIDNFYPYILEEDDDDVICYSFITSCGSIYVVYFDPYQYIEHVENYPNLLSSGFGFGFNRMIRSKTISNIDILIYHTISKIISDFLESCHPNTVLLYHCDYKDGKQKGRNKIFNNWYNKSSLKTSFIKRSIPIYITSENEDVTDYYVGYLTSVNNSNKELIEDEFSLFAENIIANKQP